MNNIYIGIDPGLHGGIAVLDEDGNVVDVDKMPQTPLDVLTYFRQYDIAHTAVYLEDVGHGMPGQSSKATATFARHNGHLEMALLSCGLRTIKCTPQKWMKTYQLGKSKDYSKAEWKRRLKEKCQQLFPTLGKKITLATCDALLIASYGRHQEIRNDKL